MQDSSLGPRVSFPSWWQFLGGQVQGFAWALFLLPRAPTLGCKARKTQGAPSTLRCKAQRTQGASDLLPSATGAFGLH